MRAGRLVAIVLHVQRTGRSTAPELARELEVSVRTIYRDFAALQSAGVPLWTEPGPNGGVRLVDGWRFPLDGLSGEETAALIVGGAGAADLGLGAVLAAAESKVLSALPPELRGRAARMQERFLLDVPGWFQRPEEQTALADVAEAVWSEVQLDLTYALGKGTGMSTVERRAHPLGLVLKAGTWYLVAGVDGRVRTYRVSRIVRARRRSERADRPAGFELGAWWRGSIDAFDRSLLRLPVRLRLDERALRQITVVIPGPSTAQAVEGAAPGPDGWTELVVNVESEAVALSQLAGLTGGVEVLEPVTLRASLQAHGAALAARHRPVPGGPPARGHGS